jgi:hypothetical protein
VPIAGLVLASIGLSTWKKQLWGKTEYEISKKLLKATYKYREAVSAVRNPFIPIQEMPNPPKDHPASTDDKKKSFYGIAAAYENRWNKVSGVRRELEAILLEAEVIWGVGIKTKLNHLFSVEKKLFLNLRRYLDTINPEIDYKMEFDRKIIYLEMTEDDEYTKELYQAINEVEKELKQYLNRKK